MLSDTRIMLNVVEPARYIKVNLLFLHSEVHLRGEEIKVPINCIINIMKRGEKKEVQSFTADFNLQKVVTVQQCPTFISQIKIHSPKHTFISSNEHICRMENTFV